LTPVDRTAICVFPIPRQHQRAYAAPCSRKPAVDDAPGHFEKHADPGHVGWVFIPAEWSRARQQGAIDHREPRDGDVPVHGIARISRAQVVERERRARDGDLLAKTLILTADDRPAGVAGALRKLAIKGVDNGVVGLADSAREIPVEEAEVGVPAPPQRLPHAVERRHTRAARMPITTMTTSSSMRVKPRAGGLRAGVGVVMGLSDSGRRDV
jgi:hypothetical protein